MSKPERKWPRCPECGGRIALRAGPGRTREFRRGVHLEIPDDFQLPTCSQCSEVLMVPEISGPLDELLGATYRDRLKREIETCVAVLRARHGVTQQEIEDAAGVTRSYLSHLLSGRKEPSLTLMKLIRSFVIAPDAFEHARTHQSLGAYLGELFEVVSGETAKVSPGGGFASLQVYGTSAGWGPVSENWSRCA